MSEENKQHPFITYLEGHADDRAMLAELRRGLGRTPEESPGMFQYVMPFVHEHTSRWEETNMYSIASLFALHPVSAAKGNIGEHLHSYVLAVGDDAATTRRFVQLLRQDRPSLDIPLRQHISILRSKEIPVNWHQLMFDLNYWDHPNRFVQKRWARGYWRPVRQQ